MNRVGFDNQQCSVSPCADLADFDVRPRSLETQIQFIHRVSKLATHVEQERWRHRAICLVIMYEGSNRWSVCLHSTDVLDKALQYRKDLLNGELLWNNNGVAKEGSTLWIKESVLSKAKEPRHLSQIANTKIYFGHVTRRNNDYLERLVIFVKLEGSRPRGRSLRKSSDEIKQCTNKTSRYQIGFRLPAMLWIEISGEK